VEVEGVSTLRHNSLHQGQLVLKAASVHTRTVTRALVGVWEAELEDVLRRCLVRRILGNYMVGGE
jgi:hypothetical protein